MGMRPVRHPEPRSVGTTGLLLIGVIVLAALFATIMGVSPGPFGLAGVIGALTGLISVIATLFARTLTDEAGDDG
jgi:uncharacterized protein (DUF697 family)